MKNQFQNLSSFVAELERREAAKEDYISDTRNVVMREEGTGLELRGIGEYGLTQHAHGQVAEFVGVPKQFYDRIGDVPGLRAETVNRLLRYQEMQQKPNESAKRLVRTLDGNVRALLSDRYRPIDNGFILNAFLPVLSEVHPDLKVVSSNLSEKSMYVQLVFPKLTGEVTVGDVVQWGVLVSNSEVGAGAVNIESLVWRLRCLNGAVFQSLISRRHVGRRVGGDVADYGIFKDDTIDAELKSYQLRIRDIVTDAMTEAHFKGVLENLQGAVGDVVAKPVELIQKVTQRYGLPQADAAKILENMEAEKNFNRYGLFNGLTALAKGIDDADKAVAYERAGADIIELSKADWKVLNEEAA